MPDQIIEAVASEIERVGMVNGGELHQSGGDSGYQALAHAKGVGAPPTPSHRILRASQPTTNRVHLPHGMLTCGALMTSSGAQPAPAQPDITARRSL